MNGKDILPILTAYIVAGTVYYIYAFSKADADSSGSVTEAEMNAYFEGEGLLNAVFGPIVPILNEIGALAGFVETV